MRALSSALVPRRAEILIRLPAVQRKAAPQLLGMLDHGAGIEMFLGWVDPKSEPGKLCTSHRNIPGHTRN